MSPKVSIVLITYNQEEFIRETLVSCLNQDYPNLEIIVCDDGSKDKTPDIIKEYADKYPNKIVPVLHPVNTGIAGNLNRGLNAANGEYIAWLGGDDMMLQHKISSQVIYLDTHPDLSGCYHDAEVFEWPSNTILGQFSQLRGKKAYNKSQVVDATKMLNPRYQMLPSTVMVRKAMTPEHGFDTRLKMLNDYLFDIETIINGGGYGFMEGVYTRYRKHDNNVGSNTTIKKLTLEENLMTMAIIEARYPYLETYIQKRIPYYILVEAMKALSGNNKKRFKELCFLAIRKGFWFRGLNTFIFGHFFVSIINSNKKNKLIPFLKKFF